MRLSSFLDALRGLVFLLRTERNARVHALATIVVVALGLVLGVDANAWCWLVLSTALVWITEALNTAIERLADRVTAERNPLIRQAKDVAAGAVLLSAGSAVVIGVLVLGPPLRRWLRA